MVLRVKCLGYIDQRQTSVCSPTAYAVQTRGGGGGEALKERFGRGVSPRPLNRDAVFKTAHD